MTHKKTEEFTQAVRDEVETVAAEDSGFSLLFTRLAKLWNVIDIGDLIPDELTEAEVVAAVRKVWDESIVPIDIPYVPEFVETILERMCWKVVEDKIRAWFPDSPAPTGERSAK